MSESEQAIPAVEDPNRDAIGRFVAGNKAARGNKGGRPPRTRDYEIIRQMETQVTAGQIQSIIARAVQDAIDGDRFARRWVWDYLVGRPVTSAPAPDGKDSPLAQLIEQLTGEAEDVD